MADNPSQNGGGASRHERLKAAAARYGEASLQNYARIRSLAERIETGFCAWMAPDNPPCVHLVPPTGAFAPRSYGSAAFSVSGGGFLPLGPIAFGLALRVSEGGDWLRIVLTCMQEGGELVVRIKDGKAYEFDVPVSEEALEDFFAHLFRFAENWFAERVRLYESGAYGDTSIGFELVHIGDGEPAAADGSDTA